MSACSISFAMDCLSAAMRRLTSAMVKPGSKLSTISTKTTRPDRLDRKAVAASPQRQRALPTQPILIDHQRTAGRRLPGRHQQYGTLAIVRQGVRPQRQCDQPAIGQLRHAAGLVA